MKKLLIICILFVTQISNSAILEVNELEKKVYMHSTPQVQVSLQDLGSDGGVIYVQTKYDSQQIQAELLQIQKQYSGFEIVNLVARKKTNAVIDIDQVIHQELVTNEEQLGPQVNTVIEVTKEQIVLLRKLNFEKAVRFQIPAQLIYASTQVIEEYVADSKICDMLSIKSARELILNFAKIQKPAAIKLTDTFDSLKESILNNCYRVDESRVSSISDLLNLPVTPLRANRVIKGQTFKKVDLKKEFLILPHIKTEKI